MNRSRTAAVVTWVYAAMFGVPAVPVAIFLAEQGRLPSLWGLFDMYAGPWSAWFAYDRVIGLLLVYAGLMLAAPVTSYGRCARPARCSTWYCCRRRQPSGSVSLSPFPGCSRSRESRWWPRGGRSSPGRAIGPLLRRQDGVVHRNEPRVDSPLEWAETRSVKSTRTLRARVARTSRLSGSPSGRLWADAGAVAKSLAGRGLVGYREPRRPALVAEALLADWRVCTP